LELSAAVTFTFQDVDAPYAPGLSGSPNNSATVVRGTSFSFDIWMNASAGEQVAGFSFLLNFKEYAGGPAFSLLSNLERDPAGSLVSAFEGFGAFSNGPELLKPDNVDPVTGFGDDLGGALPVSHPDGWLTDVLYVGRATLYAPGALPKGTYHIRPNSVSYGYTEYVPPDYNSVPLGPNSYTDYTVILVPEPGQVGLAVGVGLLALGIGRRFAVTRDRCV
jgi:hypothetical protein